MKDWKTLEGSVTTPTGKRWVKYAGAWADTPIKPCPRHDLMNFTVKEIRVDDCVIDPRKIVGTTHASYNQGMTWREVLACGKRVKRKLEKLETEPEYYDDPKVYATDSEPWHLIEIGDELYTSIGNHRSVVAKFRAHEDKRTDQLVSSVDRLIVSEVAQRQYEALQKDYLPGECDSGPERELVYENGDTREYRIFVQCRLHDAKGGTFHTLPLEEAAAYVMEWQKFSRPIFNLFPKLWKRIYCP